MARRASECRGVDAIAPALADYPARRSRRPCAPRSGRSRRGPTPGFIARLQGPRPLRREACCPPAIGRRRSSPPPAWACSTTTCGPTPSTARRRSTRSTAGPPGSWPRSRCSTQHAHPDDRAQRTAAVARAHDHEGDGRYSLEYRIIRADGEVRWVNTRAQTFFEGSGPARPPVRVIGAITDVTDARAAARAAAGSRGPAAPRRDAGAHGALHARQRRRRAPSGPTATRCCSGSAPTRTRRSTSSSPACTPTTSPRSRPGAAPRHRAGQGRQAGIGRRRRRAPRRERLE